MPDARGTGDPVRNGVVVARTSIQGSGGNPTFPAQWLYGLYRALPGERLFCLRRHPGHEPPGNLTPAPRRQDHTSSPYASAPFVVGTSTSTATLPTFVTRPTPLFLGRDGDRYA